MLKIKSPEQYQSTSLQLLKVFSSFSLFSLLSHSQQTFLVFQDVLKTSSAYQYIIFQDIFKTSSKTMSSRHLQDVFLRRILQDVFNTDVLQGSLEDVFSVTTSHLSRCLSHTSFKMTSSRCLQDAPSKTPLANMSWRRLEKIVLEDVMKTFWKAIIFYPEDVLKTSLTCLH